MELWAVSRPGRFRSFPGADYYWAADRARGKTGLGKLYAAPRLRASYSRRRRP